MFVKNTKTFFSLLVMLIVSAAFTAAYAEQTSVTIIDESWNDVNCWNISNSSEIKALNSHLELSSDSSTEIKAYRYRSTNAGKYFPCLVGEHYAFEAAAKVENHFDGDIQSGYSLRFTLCNSKTSVVLSVANDGLYILNNNNENEKIKDMLFDTNEHIYRVEMDGENADIIFDGELIYSYAPPTGITYDDVKISAQGISTAYVAALKLEKFIDGTTIIDYMTDLSKADSYNNLEIASYDSMFFSKNIQADFIDETKDASIVYKVPDGNTIADFTVYTRHNPQNQGTLSFQISSDGISWSNYTSTYGIISKWFYASGGHRMTSIPDSNMKSALESAKFLKISFGAAGAGGEASESSPSLLQVEISYSKSEFLKAQCGEVELSEDKENIISPFTEKIDLFFTKNIAFDKDSKAIVLKNNETETECDFEYIASEHKLSVIPKKELLYDSIYMLMIDDSLSCKKLPKEFELKTPKTGFTLGNIHYVGNEESLSAECDINNYTKNAQNVSLIIAAYKDGIMISWDFVKYDIPAFGKKTGVTTPSLNAQDYDEIAVMLWDSPKNMIPLAFFEKEKK